jgi:hypothetical protein
MLIAGDRKRADAEGPGRSVGREFASGAAAVKKVSLVV